MRDKKNLRRISVKVTAQTAYNLGYWLPCAGTGTWGA